MRRRAVSIGALALLVFSVWLVREVRRASDVAPPARAERWIHAPHGRVITGPGGEALTPPAPRVQPPHPPPSRPGLPPTMRLLPGQRTQHAAPLPGGS